MVSKDKDLTGQRFGLLTVLEPAEIGKRGVKRGFAAAIADICSYTEIINNVVYIHEVSGGLRHYVKVMP